MSKIIRTSTASKKDSFSKFFRSASKEEKISVFKKAARKANLDQVKLEKRVKLRLKNA